MFGLVMADVGQLTPEQKETYHAYYCGLCRALGAQAGLRGRLTLNFDLTFLILLLSAYHQEEETRETFRCPAHPTKKFTSVTTAHTAYAAQMNLLLMREKLLDDWRDDKSVPALAAQKTLSKAANRAAEAYPQKARIIREALDGLVRAEADGEHNPDVPAACFGRLTAGLFDVNGNDETLRQFGFALGKAVYVMDACIDLRRDLKKGRYNAMVEIPSKEFQQILTVLLGDCTSIYDTMSLTRHKEILDNILFSGIWNRYRRSKT